mgnify:CR=1 FL=1
MKLAKQKYVATNEAFRLRCLYENITMNLSRKLFQSLIEVSKKTNKEGETYNTAYYQMLATFWGVEFNVDAKATITDLPAAEYKLNLDELIRTKRVILCLS